MPRAAKGAIPGKLLLAAHRSNRAFHACSLGTRCGRVLGGAFGLNLVSAEISVGRVVPVDNRLRTVFKSVRESVRSNVCDGDGFLILGEPETDLSGVPRDGALRSEERRVGKEGSSG